MTPPTDMAALPDLSPFIRCYSVRPIYKKGLYALKPIKALHEVCLVFILNKVATAIDEEMLKARPYYVCGISTTGESNVFFNEPCTVFYIHFKPNGFHKIFSRSPKDVLNKTVNAVTFLGQPLQTFGDALNECKNNDQLRVVADAFFLQLIAKQTTTQLFDSITDASNIILNNININTAQLAKNVNMSLRNFERRFQEQVGIPAKFYCRIVRFTNALMLKINSTQKDWTSIAQACGYFDQMHFIKDCRQFTGCSPSGFIRAFTLSEDLNNNFSAT